jgi:hypothetical protein
VQRAKFDVQAQSPQRSHRPQQFIKPSIITSLHQSNKVWRTVEFIAYWICVVSGTDNQAPSLAPRSTAATAMVPATHMMSQTRLFISPTRSDHAPDFGNEQV